MIGDPKGSEPSKNQSENIQIGPNGKTVFARSEIWWYNYGYLKNYYGDDTESTRTYRGHHHGP